MIQPAVPSCRKVQQIKRKDQQPRSFSYATPADRHRLIYLMMNARSVVRQAHAGKAGWEAEGRRFIPDRNFLFSNKKNRESAEVLGDFFSCSHEVEENFPLSADEKELISVVEKGKTSFRWPCPIAGTFATLIAEPFQYEGYGPQQCHYRDFLWEIVLERLNLSNTLHHIYCILNDRGGFMATNIQTATKTSSFLKNSSTSYRRKAFIALAARFSYFVILILPVSD